MNYVVSTPYVGISFYVSETVMTFKSHIPNFKAYCKAFGSYSHFYNILFAVTIEFCCP